MSQLLVKEIQDHPDLSSYTLENLPLLKELLARYYDVPIEVCIERAQYITDYMKNPENPGDSMELKRAKAIRYYMRNRKAIFHNNNLLAASSTSKELGAPVYPELLGMSIWPELETISKRKINPQKLSPSDAEKLNFEIFPYWIDKTVLEMTRAKIKNENNQEVGEALKLMEKIAFFLAGKTTVITHTTPYFEKVMSRGLKAMIAEARSMANDLPNHEKEKKEFYEAMEIAMLGILEYTVNLSREAENLAIHAASEKEKQHYLEISRVCSRVPAEPAETFREAINSLWICDAAIMAENVNMALNPGRLDQILFPYFKKDIQAGRITVEQALTLCGCLWLKISDNTNLVPGSAERMFGGAGSVPAVTLGGVDQNGADAVNDLTYIMLRVTELLKTKDPNVNARYYPNVNSPDYLKRVASVVINTGAIPALYNDQANIETLVNQGVSLPHARDYAIIGCVELSSAGREYASTSSILLNLSSVMDMTLYNGKRPYICGNDWQIGPKTGEPETFTTFTQFQTAFETQLKALIDKAVKLNNELGKMHQKILPTPLLSCFFEGPMEKGLDLIHGGALYNSSGVTHVGFADICDSLNAIEDAVFVNKKFTMAQMKGAIEKNFVSQSNEDRYEQLLHEYVQNSPHKYGRDDSLDEHPIAVKNSQWLIKFLYDIYQNYQNYRGGKYRPAFWTMTNHAGLGKIGHALPSGRKANEVFSSGITPCSQMTPDLTTAYRCVAKLGHNYIPGGVALNIKYTPEVFESGNLDSYQKHFTDQVEGYFAYGGMQVQYNIQSYEHLEEARLNPKKNPHLIVRVSGYSAYFNDLNEAMKQELIWRTQYNLNNGKAVPYSNPGQASNKQEETK